MEFRKGPLQREQFKSRAETQTRSMCDSYGSNKTDLADEDGFVRQQY